MIREPSSPGHRPPRPGSYLNPSPERRLPIPDVKIRCSDQAPDEPPRFARPRFAWNMSEVSGALGDLGTFLPHILGAIAVVGMPPAGVLIWFGLFYIAAGVYYGVPMGVQPMKAASAAVLIQQMTPGEVSGAGLVIGAFFLVLGLSGLASRVSRLIPASVTAGIQLGLGVSLAILGVKLIEQQLWLGIAITGVMLLLLSNRRLPAALVGLALGVAVATLVGPRMPLPLLDLGLHLPHFIWPTWNELVTGTEVMVLPQIPLTLTNAIIVTAAVTHELFPKDVHHVNERNLAVTTGLGNLLAAPFGGYLMCLGAGGIAGHYRFGARTAAAPVTIGVAFLLLGVILGDGAIPLFKLIPAAVLGALLFFSGVELALSSRPQGYAGPEIFVVIVIAVISIGTNPAIAFLIGLPLAYGIQRGWVRL